MLKSALGKAIEPPGAEGGIISGQLEEPVGSSESPTLFLGPRNKYRVGGRASTPGGGCLGRWPLAEPGDNSDRG